MIKCLKFLKSIFKRTKAEKCAKCINWNETYKYANTGVCSLTNSTVEYDFKCEKGRLNPNLINSDSCKVHIHCPDCGAELISSNCSMGDCYYGFAKYKCRKCGTVSKWDFDSEIPLIIISYKPLNNLILR